MLNLSALKNVITGLTPALPAASSSPASTADVVKAQVDLKQKQLRRGTTRTEVERVKGKLEAARVALTQSERVDADEDSTAVMQRMTRAEEDVRDVEKELTVAIRKDDAALADLKDAERLVAAETEAAACVRVLALGPRFEEVSALVRQLAVDTARETEALRVVGGNEKYAYGAREIRGQFDLFFGLAKHPLTNNGHVPEAFMKYKTFSACLEAICGMKARV